MRAAEVELGARHVAAVMTGESGYTGGELDVPLSRGFAATAEVFWSERLSTHVAATFVNPAAFLHPSGALQNEIDLATIGLDIYAVTARYHFAERRRFSGYAGAGAAFVSIGDLEDRFADDIEMQFDAQTTAAVSGGIRYHLRPRLHLELDATWLPLSADTIVLRNEQGSVTLPPSIDLDPVIVGVGAAWRF